MCDRLHWAPGTPLEVVETAEGISLRASEAKRHFPLTTLADLRTFPPYEDTPQPIEAISAFSDEDIRRLLDEQDEGR